MAVHPIIHVKLLGAFSANTEHGEEVHINAKKSKALIAYLLSTTQKRHSREHLATLLWDSHDETKARANLRQAVASLRRALNDKEGVYVLGNDADFIGLNPELFHSDIDDLETGASSVSGAFLPDLVACTEPFEEWRRMEAARITSLMQARLGDALDRAVAAGDSGDIILAAAQLLEVDVLDESAHIAKFNAELKAGAPRAAVATFHHYKRLLASEAAAEPPVHFTRAADDVRRSLGVTDIASQKTPEKAHKPDKGRLFSIRFDRLAVTSILTGAILFVTVVAALRSEKEAPPAIYEQTHVRTAMEKEWQAAAYDNYPNLRRYISQCKFDGDEDTQKTIWTCSYILQELHHSEPYRALVFAIRADAHRWAGEYEQAIKDYRAALDLQPEHYNAIHGLAYAYSLSGRHDLAITHYAQVRALVPIHFMALYRMGEAYFAKGDYLKAAEIFSQAVRENPNSAFAHYHLGLSHMRLEQTAEAKTHFKQAARLDPGVRTQAERFYAELVHAEQASE